MKAIVWLLSFIVSALAYVDDHPIFKDSVTKSCAYVHKADSWPESIFAKLSPKLQLSPINGNYSNRKIHHIGASNIAEPSEEGIQLHTLILQADDILKIDFGAGYSYDMCDEVALEMGFCFGSKTPGAKVSLSEFIESRNSTSIFESFDYNTNTEFEYTFDKSGVYCVVFYMDVIEAPKAGELYDHLTTVRLNWQSSFGTLHLVDFKRLFLTFYLTCAYGIYFLIYAGMIARRVLNCDFSEVKSNRRMRYMFQYKILSFLAGAFLIQLITCVNYLLMNIYDYHYAPSSIVFVFGMLELISSTVFTFWTIYNLMLFSAGAWVGSLKKSSNKVLISRVICATLFCETLLHHLEEGTASTLFSNWGRVYFYGKVSTKFVIISTLCFIWSFYTTYKIQNKQTKKLYVKSVLLLGFMFLGSLILHFVFRFYKIEYFTKAILLVTMIIFSLL